MESVFCDVKNILQGEFKIGSNKAEALLKVIPILFDIGLDELSIELLENSIQIIHSIERETSRDSSLLELVKIMAELKMFDDAYKQIEFIMHESDRSRALGALGTCLLAVGETDRAYSVYNMAPYKSEISELESSLINSFMKYGKYAVVISQISNKSIDQYIEIISSSISQITVIEAHTQHQVLSEIIRIVSWVRDDWFPVYQILSN